MQNTFTGINQALQDDIQDTDEVGRRTILSNSFVGLKSWDTDNLHIVQVFLNKCS